MNNKSPKNSPPQPTNTQTFKTFGLVSMVLGIVSIISLFVTTGLLFIPSIVLAIAAIVFGIIAISKKAPKAQAVTGIVSGSAALLFCVVLFLFFATLLTSWSNYYENRDQEERRERIENREMVDNLQKNFMKGQTGEFGDITLKVVGSRQGDEASGSADFTIYEVEIQNQNGTRFSIDPTDFAFLTGGRTVPLAKTGPDSFERTQLDSNETIQTEFAINNSEVTENMSIQYETRIKTAGATFTLRI